jgi:uncharacterized protein (TIGR02757 family)
MARSSDSAKKKELKLLLDEKADQYNTPEFIAADPISIPHRLSKKEDIEIIGFIIASIAWGNRSAILKSGEKLLDIMGYEPYEYIKHASKKDLNDLNFVHRTFNKTDLTFFIHTLRNLYAQKTGLEGAFGGAAFQGTIKDRIIHFRNTLFEITHEKRSEKHVSSPLSNSACKRINMYLRWMVRNDKRKVDFGIWKSIPMADLYLPLDVHTGRVARDLGLLNRTKDDWQALEELMAVLQTFDAKDPVKYDFALFGIGVNEYKKEVRG